MNGSSGSFRQWLVWFSLLLECNKIMGGKNKDTAIEKWNIQWWEAEEPKKKRQDTHEHCCCFGLDLGITLTRSKVSSSTSITHTPSCTDYDDIITPPYKKDYDHLGWHQRSQKQESSLIETNLNIHSTLLSRWLIWPLIDLTTVLCDICKPMCTRKE